MDASATQDSVEITQSVAVRHSRRRPSGQALLALLVGLLMTALLAIVAQLIYDHNEARLLRLRGHELDLVLAGIVPTIQAPLASAAELADLTHGNVSRFEALAQPYAGKGKEFVSISLWSLSPSARVKPLVVLGTTPTLLRAPARARAFLARAHSNAGLDVMGALASKTPSLDYAYAQAGTGTATGFAVFAESVLPSNRRLQLPKGDGLTGLNYALYLGRSQRREALLLTNLAEPPRRGEGVSVAVPFANSALTLVVTPDGSLGGAFFAVLPWIIGGGGALLALLGAMLTDRLVQRRDQAEALALNLDGVARENRALYREQWSIAQTLQHSLLPETLPRIAGLASFARYVPAAAGIDVGGDWYDLRAISEHEALLMIGDVAGHGLQAATTMAALRHAMLAYAAEDPRPASVLRRLADFVASSQSQQFATTLCALIDTEQRRVVLASAGHPPPLLIEGGRAGFVELQPGVPIGAPLGAAGYCETSLSIGEHATMIVYTDGLIERRGESIDVGMARLQQAATLDIPLDGLIERLARELASQNNDDTAILGVRWQD